MIGRPCSSAQKRHYRKTELSSTVMNVCARAASLLRRRRASAMSTTKNASKTNCSNFTLQFRHSRGKVPGMHAKAVHSVKMTIKEEKTCSNWSLMRCALGTVKCPRLRSSARTGVSSMLRSSSSSIRESKKQEGESRRWIGLQSQRLRKMTARV